jgi:hypothetical protein
MAEYAAPLRDMKFVIKELAGPMPSRACLVAKKLRRTCGRRAGGGVFAAGVLSPQPVGRPD